MKYWFHDYRSHIYLTDPQKRFLSTFPDDESFNEYSIRVLGMDYFLKTSKISIVDVCVKLGIS